MDEELIQKYENIIKDLVDTLVDNKQDICYLCDSIAEKTCNRNCANNVINTFKRQYEIKENI